MQGSKWVAATRIGFAARGIMYLLIGWLALRSGRAEDGTGILAYLASGAGRLLLAAMAIGFLAYGAWRLADAWTDGSGRGADAKGVAIRAGGGVSGIVHLGLGLVAAIHASGTGGAGGGDGDSAREGARTALSLPGGSVLLLLAAAALVLTGLFQLKKAWSLDFMTDLERGRGRGDWVCWLGRAGYSARGIVFVMMGWFLWRAAVEHRSSEAGGLGEALASLSATPQMAVAAGLFLFGLFSLVEARYRRIHRPHPLTGGP